jgi:hypothetical protein
MADKKIVSREEYYANHVLCPKCKTWEKVRVSPVYIITSEGKDFKDNVNTAICDACNWRGMRKDLLKPLEN